MPRQVVATLLELGADPGEPDGSGRTPLHVACRYGYGEIAALLLANPRTDLGAIATVRACMRVAACVRACGGRVLRGGGASSLPVFSELPLS